MTPAQRRAVEDLTAQGVTTLSVEGLDTSAETWIALSALGERFRRGVAQLLDRDGSAPVPWLAHNEAKIARYLGNNGRSDDYLIKLHPEAPILVPDDPLLRFGVSEPVLAIVNSYLGLHARLHYADMWQTIRATSPRRIGSQRWHRDFEDARMVKVYAYVSDIAAEAGPLEYVVGSQPGGKYRRLFPWRRNVSRYPPDGEVERRVPDADRIQSVGRAGTVLLCDTSGLHRGSPTLAGERIVATWTYVTPACPHRRRFRLSPAARLADLAEAQRSALS